MKLSIVIPIYNERRTAPVLLDQVLAFSLSGLDKEIIIVEGNSTDGTREVVRGYESKPGVRVVYEEKPGGKGAAVRRGLALVTGDLVLIQDGDLEYRVEDYPKLLKPLLEDQADVVLGSRALDPSTHWQYRKFAGAERLFGFMVNLGGVVLTGLFNLLYGTRLSDGATMFKFFRARDLKDLRLRSNGFDYDWEILAKLAKKKLRFAEIPILYKARNRAEGKKIRFWRDGWKVTLAIVRYRFSN